MASSNDHPGLPFVQAQGYTRGRPDGQPLWIVWHTMEAGENSQRAESTAAYFADPSDGRQVSSHYCADNDSVVQCVDLDDVAWTVGNRPGNNRGINWELSGFANQTRDQWLDAFGKSMFHQVVPLVVADAARFGIPHRRCTVNDLAARKPGHTTHNDLRLAFGVTTHTDPGTGFPFDYLFSLISNFIAGGTDMATYLIEVFPNGTEQVIATNGTTRWPISDWGPIGKVLGIPFPTVKVTTAEAASFGLDLSKLSGTGTGGLTFDQAVEAARQGAEKAEDS